MKNYEVHVNAEKWNVCYEVEPETAMNEYNECVRCAVANNSLRVTLTENGKVVAEWTREAWVAEDDD